LTDVRSEILSAYCRLARCRGDWVRIAELRQQLAHLGHDLVTAELRAMELDRVAHLVPQANQKVLTATDHAAAVRIGMDRCHLMSIP